MSMTTIALWICVCADDWAAELAIKASNGVSFILLIEGVCIPACTWVGDLVKGEYGERECGEGVWRSGLYNPLSWTQPCTVGGTHPTGLHSFWRVKNVDLIFLFLTFLNGWPLTTKWNKTLISVGDGEQNQSNWDQLIPSAMVSSSRMISHLSC